MAAAGQSARPCVWERTTNRLLEDAAARDAAIRRISLPLPPPCGWVRTQVLVRATPARAISMLATAVDISHVGLCIGDGIEVRAPKPKRW